MAYGFNDNKTKASIEAIANQAAANKVDKVAGKGLSDNNYTNTDKNIVSGIPAALSNKVDKVAGKQLTTNDFTTAYKTKVEEASYNTFGEYVEISNNGTNNYSESNPYTCPHNGYVRLKNPNAVYGAQPEANLYTQTGSYWINQKIKYGSIGEKIVFVKKGAKIYGTTSPENASGTIFYYPMTSYT